MNIVIAHPGKQTSYHAAEALFKSGDLTFFFTTMYDKKGSLARFLSFFAPRRLKAQLKKRRCDVPDEKIRLVCQWQGLWVWLCSHLPFLHRFLLRANQRLNASFGRRVAAFINKQKNIDAVISYETNSTVLFNSISPSVSTIRILEMSTLARPFSEETLKNENELFPELNINDTYKTYFDKKNRESHREELRLADVFLVPSQACKESLNYCGISDDRIFLCRYGVDLKRFRERQFYRPFKDVLRVLFVGNVTCIKGIQRLIPVIESFGGKATLEICGEFQESDPLYRKFGRAKNVFFEGKKTWEELVKIYQDADLFCLPSLSDGFGQVVFEAMACGCPVLVTKTTGACDAVSKTSGFVVDEPTFDALAEKIQWSLEHPIELSNMGRSAAKEVLAFAWTEYEKKLPKVLIQISKTVQKG